MVAMVSLTAILACGLFAGAAIYINLVEHPARLSVGTEAAAKQWAPSYKRATIMQASLALVATVAGGLRWLQSQDALWLLGAGTIFLVIPFTLFVIRPTNTKLLEPGRDLSSKETRSLLESWGRLHAVRSVLSLVSTVIYICTATH